jgi:hypothetical protein
MRSGRWTDLKKADVEQANTNLKKIIRSCVLFIVLCSVVVVLITVCYRLALWSYDEDYFIGISVAISFGIAMPIMMLILSSIAKANLDKNPKLLFGMSIGTLVLSICTMALAFGAVQIAIGFEEDVVLGFIGGDPAYIMAFGFNLAEVTILAILVINSVVLIVSASKNLKIGQPYIQSGAGSKSGGNYCAKCGASNGVDAQYCKKCGKAL